MLENLSSEPMMRRKVLAVCGPTASGKSRISDDIAARLTKETGARSTCIVVDSMQVYSELPVISNQARDRPAELVGVVSVAEEWTVARHRSAVHDIIERTDGPIVLDAGTGMYLNAVLLDLALAPRVEPEARREAERAVLARGDPPENARRAVREEELRMAGASPRSSIWDGDLIFDVALIYLRSPRPVLDKSIEARSRTISSHGLDEARILKEMEQAGTPPNPSVQTSIGVRELRQHMEGGISLSEAEQLIAARTRRLARRQIRWFDKLTRALDGRADTIVADHPEDTVLAHKSHDIIGSWELGRA
jgi:tRNA dimethylallyltransferase